MRNVISASPKDEVRRFRQSARLLFAALFVYATLNCAGKAAADDWHQITARDLVNIKDIGGHHIGAMSVSPDGEYVASQLQIPNIKARSYDLSWHIVETKTDGAQWKISDGGDLILNPDMSWLTNGNRPPIEAQWSPDSEWIYYLKCVHGSTQVWRSRIESGDTEQLTHHAGDVLSFQLSDDGGAMFFTAAFPEEEMSRELQKEGDHGFLYDERFYASLRRGPFARVCSINEEGRLQKVSIERACEPLLWIYDIASKKERRATTEEIEANSQKDNEVPWPIFSLTNSDRYLIDKADDGDRILLVNEDPKKFPGYRPPLRLFALFEDKKYRCPAKECYAYQGIIEGVWWRPGRDEIIFQRADGSSASMTGLYSWVPGADHVRKIIRTEDQFWDCQVLEDSAICLREQWTHPRTIVSIDLDSGKIDAIYDPNPEFDKIKFSKIEKFEWEDEFGNPTHGHLVYPLYYEPGRRYPLVITTYRSRGFLRGAVGDEYPIHLLAANGFMVLSHDMPRPFRRNATVLYSGRAQFEGNYERRSSLSAQQEILNILDKRGLIDPDRVAITGLSDGAEQVTFALIHTNSFAAAIASSAFDWRSAYYSHTAKGRAFRRRMLGGTPYEDKEGLYRAMSLGMNAGRVNTPLLVNVSDQGLATSVESFARLQDAGKPVEMYVFPGEYHIKWQPQHRLAIYRRNVQWLKFWLMGKEEGDPVSPGQYARWRKMRDAQCERLNGTNAPWYCDHASA